MERKGRERERGRVVVVIDAIEAGEWSCEASLVCSSRFLLIIPKQEIAMWKIAE